MFDQKLVDELEKKITIKDDKPYVVCAIRDKEIILKPGGRMAIVLPQGRFNNTSDKTIREYIAEKARILAVVGLHVNTFKPHTGTKTG